MKLWLLACVAVLYGCKQHDAQPDKPPVPPSREEAPVPPPPQACTPNKTVCDGDAVFQCNGDGQFGRLLHACKGRCANGACVDTCAVQGVELIYVVDAQRHLLSFDPRKKVDDPFHLIGTLDCSSSTTPYSMAVDREGIAWVLYDDGDVYQASIVDAYCSPGPAYRQESDRPRLFGMGYVSDGPKATTEKLFVAGADDRRLATLDVSQGPSWHPVGTIGPASSQPPELTGTAAGELFAFFPDAKGAFIQQLDRHSGKGVGRRMLVGSPDGTVNGWAFAFWGGVFYVFVTIDDNSMVIAVDRKTGNHRIIREHLPYRIVGAGVSTCAPLLERPGTE